MTMPLKVVYLPLSWIIRLSLPLLALPLVAQAAEAGRTLADCQAITDRSARFDCYDKVDIPKGTVPAGATQSSIPARQPPPPSPTEQADNKSATSGSAKLNTVGTSEPAKKPFYKRLLPFGWGDDKEKVDSADTAATPQKKPVGDGDSTVENFGVFSKAATVHTADAGVQELVDTVASIKNVGPNMVSVTLSSGQVWRQMYDHAYLLEVGEEVRIRPSGWGASYRLYSQRLGGYIQVERVDR